MFEFLGFCAAIGLMVWLLRRPKARAVEASHRQSVNRAAQDAVEALTLELLVEYGKLDDAGVAQLVRDELLNRRWADSATMAWATEETVARMRRTLARHLIAAERGRAHGIDVTAESQRAKELPPTVRLKTCKTCGVENRGDARTCRKCLNLFPV